MLKEPEHVDEITLFSNEDVFPLKIKFVDRDDHITDYILFKTRNEKLLLQKPLFNESTTDQR